MSRWLPRAVFAALLIVSAVMFFTPGPDVPRHGPNDKVVHATIFVVLALSGRWARGPAVPLGLALVAYGALTEVLQATLPIQRDGDVHDWLADSLGVMVGLSLAWLVSRLSSRRRPG